MDIREQLRTWRAFTGYIRWLTAGMTVFLLTVVLLGLCH